MWDSPDQPLQRTHQAEVISLSERRASEHITHALSRREQLRAQARHAMSGQLRPQDIGALVAIGLLGALPARPVEGFPDALNSAMGVGAMGRDKLAQALAGQAGVPMPVDELLKTVQESFPEQLGWVRDIVGDVDLGTIQSIGLDTKALEEGLRYAEDTQQGAGATISLTSWWCNRQGWDSNSQIYHEAHALTNALSACISGFVQPNPILFAKAGWHFYKALRASRQLTDMLAELVAEAAEESERIGQDYERESALTDLARRAYEYEVELTEQTRPNTLGSRAVGALGDAGGLFTTTSKKKVW